MPIIDDRTAHLNLALPNVANALEDDVARLRSAFSSIDTLFSNVNNTSDSSKPVSTAQSAADAAVLLAANTHAEALVVGLWDDRGSFNASSNTYPTTGGSGAAGSILKGDIWTISVAATAGVLLGFAVGSTVRAVADAPGQTVGNWSSVSVGLGYVPENSASKNASGGYAGLTLFKLNLRNAANTITSWFTTAATVARTWTLPDKDGTVAMLSDIPVGVPVVNSSSYTYNADGTVATAPEVTSAGTRTNAFTYNADGTVATVVSVLAGVTRTETYTYNADGTIASMAAT